MMYETARIKSPFCRNNGRQRRSCAQRLVAPEDNRIVHLVKDGELGSTRVALLHVRGKILSLGRVGLAVEISNQILCSMTDRTFIHDWHFHYLALRI